MSARKDLQEYEWRYVIAPAVKQRDGYRCTACGSGTDLTVDHIIPHSRGGTNEMSNLRTLCRTCNSTKGDKEKKRTNYYNEKWLDNLHN